MGAIDGSPLQFDDLQLMGGAAFRLNAASPADLTWVGPAGNRCNLKTGSQWLTVESGSSAKPLDELILATHADAQATLDILAIDQNCFLSIPSAHEKNILWTRSQNGVQLNMTVSAATTVRSTCSATVRSADGTIVPQQARSMPTWHESMRYLRYSQLRNDLYVAYRERFLALESLYSTISVQNPGEREVDWLIRVTREIKTRYKAISFDDLVPVTSVDKPGDFISKQFRAYRSALAHAKLNKPHFLPGDLGEREDIVVALRKLNRFLDQAMRYVLALNSSRSVLTLYGYKSLVERLAPSFGLAVSSDDTPVKFEDTSISPSGAPVTKLTTRYEGISDQYGAEFSFIGSIPVSNMPQLDINTSAGFTEHGILFREHIEGLNLFGATNFQLRFLFSFNQPSELLSTFEL